MKVKVRTSYLLHWSRCETDNGVVVGPRYWNPRLPKDSDKMCRSHWQESWWGEVK